MSLTNKIMTACSGLLLCLAAPGHAAGQPEATSLGASAPGRAIVDFDPGWRFSLGASQAAMQSKFDDSAWRRVDVPHDWSIEGPFAADCGSGNGFAPGGIAWYRRHFQMPGADRGRLATLELDGVYDNAEVWLNGFFVGRRPYGFESFACDLTPFLKYGGEDNVLAVLVDHSRLADSRWYTGSGIYRHVRLRLTDRLHIGQWGTEVTTPVVSAGAATVRVSTTVENTSAQVRPLALESDILGTDGRILATATTPGTLTDGQALAIVQELDLAQPQLWSPDSPALYILRSRLRAGGAVVDETTTVFGVRTLAFDPDRGFFLNGAPTKFKGVCVHQDGGSVGVAIPLEIWERRLAVLKSLGVNAIRTSHNPPAPEFLDLCDRLGFLVMDEAFDEFTPAKNKWVVGWNQGVPGRFGYSEHFADWSVRDIQDMVRRDRNHPSIVMWSIGNEIDYPNDPFTDPALGKEYRPGNPSGKDMVKWGRPLVAAVKQLDATRPVTAALASVAMSNAVGFAQILDIDGYNYQEQRYGADRRQFPRRVVYGSENGHSFSAWEAVRDNPAISGQFLWTGIDYLGEARAWPMRANAAGLLDLCGFIKPLGRFRQSLWSNRPMVYLCAAKSGEAKMEGGNNGMPAGGETWNWPDQAALLVSCYTNCQEVTLTLNDRLVGVRRLGEAVAGVLSWAVPYVPGVLKAVGRNDGGQVCEFALQTAGPASRIELHPDVTALRANGRDVCQVEFDVVDEHGVRVPDATHELTFTLTGPAQILGLGNGDIADSEPVRGPVHRAFQGRGLAIVQSLPTPGPVTLNASAPGLGSAALTLPSR
jgi:beta-galactosidase